MEEKEFNEFDYIEDDINDEVRDEMFLRKLDKKKYKFSIEYRKEDDKGHFKAGLIYDEHSIHYITLYANSLQEAIDKLNEVDKPTKTGYDYVNHILSYSIEEVTR